MKMEFLANELKTGRVLSSLLCSHEYREFRFAVAYVRKSGVKMLEKEMKDFAARDGVAQGVVGINQGNTSYQALALLASIFPDSLYLRCGRRPRSVFHPKLYMFGGNGAEFTPSAAIVGSSNFTGGGLRSNEECGAFLRLEKGDESIQKAMTDFWMQTAVSNDTFSTVRAQPGMLSELLDAGALVDEDAAKPKRAKTGEREIVKIIDKILAAAATPLHRGFAMTLSRFDVSSKSSDPVILIPLRARDKDEKFWFWPDFFVSDRKHKDLYMNAVVTVDGLDAVERVRMYEYLQKSEFRLQSALIKRNGKEGDILVAKRDGDAISFALVRQTSAEYGDYENILNHRVSPKKAFGYF